MAGNSLKRRDLLHAAEFALPSAGVGCAVAWYLLSGAWLASFLHSAEAAPPASGSSFATCIATALALAALSMLRDRLRSRPLRWAVLLGDLVVAVALVAIAFAMAAQAGSTAWLRGAWSIVSGASYGLALCAWAQSLRDRTVRGALLSMSVGLLVAGALLGLALLGPAGALSWALGLPFASLIAFCLAQATPGWNVPPEAPAKRPARSGRLSPVVMYAVLMGFATTQFFSLNGPGAQGATVVCMVAASGLVFLFVALFLVRALGITWCLLLVGMLFGIVTVFWFALPEADALVVVTTATLHWASMLLMAAAAFRPTAARPSGPVPAACALLALFYAAAGLGSLTIVLGATSRALICAGALVVLLATFLLAQRENAQAPSGLEAPGGSEDDRGETLRSLAERYRLTPRETDVFVLIAEGNTLKHIADALVLSENTIKRHRTNVYQKLGVNSRQELIDKTRDYER